MDKKITIPMVEHFNLKMKEENSCIRYIEAFKDSNIISYKLIVEDKYIDSKYMGVNVTKEFEEMTRRFFKEYGIENTGFSNTVKTIFAMAD